MAETAIPPNGTHVEPTITVSAALRTYAALLNRATLTREGLTFAGKRDLYETLGYAPELSYRDFKARHTRGGIAARIINAFPDATWRMAPIVREKDKADETTPSPFEEAWATLADRLKVWQVVTRADRLASLGHYAVLVLGLRGQTNWETAAIPVRGGQADALYLNAYSEQHACIDRLVSDASSPLFGNPAAYRIDFSRRTSTSRVVSTDALLPALGGAFASQVTVHASRVIHLAEQGLEHDLIGTPRLEAVWNYLDDLQKVIGGSAEMYWQDAKRRIVLSLLPDASLSPDEGTALTAEVEEFMHELRNFLRVQGMEVTQLAGTIADPSDHVDKLLDLIAGTTRIPKRMLIGSERGELASTQDESNWASTIMERQQQYGQYVLRQLIDRLIALRVLETPKQGYVIEWENLLAETEQEKADTAKTWSEALKNYAGATGSPQDILPLEMFLEDIMEYPKEQVEQILQRLGDALREDQQGEADQQDEEVMAE